MTRQPLWVILCCLKKDRRKGTEELVEEKQIKEDKEKDSDSADTEEILACLLPLPTASTAGLGFTNTLSLNPCQQARTHKAEKYNIWLMS